MIINGNNALTNSFVTNTVASIVTVANGGRIINNNAIVTGSATTLIFANGSQYVSNKDGDAIPLATWNTSSTCNIIGITATNPTQLSGTFGNLVWNNAGQTSATGAISAALTINGNLSVLAGTFFDAGLIITGNSTGTFTVGAGATYNTIRTATPWMPTNFTTGNIILAPTSTFNYNGTTAHSIPNNPNGTATLTTYGHLGFLGAVTKTLGTAITVNNLTIGAGTLADGGFTLTVNGNYTNNAIHSGVGKILLSGGSAAHNITGTGTYQNLELDDVQGAVLNSTIIISGNLILTNGSFSIGSNSLTINGALTFTSGTFTGSSSSNLTLAGGANSNSIPAITNGLLNLSINRSAASTTTLTSGFTVAGNLNLLANNTLTDAGVTLTVQGNISNAGAYTGSGKIALAGGAVAHILTGTGPYSYLQLNDAQGAVMSNSFTVNGTLTLTAGAFAIGANTLTLNGTVNGNGFLSGTLTTSALVIGGTSGGNIGTINFAPGGQTLNTFQLNRTGANGSVTLGTPLTVNTTITLSANGGLLILGNNNLTYNGTAAIAGTPSVTAMIVADSEIGTGQFRKLFPAGASAAFVFPVGDMSNSTNDYSPYSITFSANSIPRTIGVILTDAEHPQNIVNGAQTDYVTRYWTFSDTEAGNGAYTYSASAYTYSTLAPSDVNGTPANYKINRWDGSNWYQLASSVAAPVVSTSGSFTETSGTLGGNSYTLRSNPAQVYTWLATSGSADWTTPESWSPARYAPFTTDELLFNQGGSSTAINVPTQTVGKILIDDTGSNGNTNITLQPSASNNTLTITNSSGVTSFNIAAGSALTVNNNVTNTLALTMTGAGSIQTIAGTFTNNSATYTPIALTVSGTYNHGFNGGVIPAATWSSGSTCNVTGIVGTAPTGLAQQYYNFNWNCPAQTINVNMAYPAGPLTIAGDLAVVNTNLSYLALSNIASTVNITGNLTISGGTFYQSVANVVNTLTVGGNLNVDGGSFIRTNGTSAQVLTVNGNLNTSGTGVLNFSSSSNGGTVNIKGNIVNNGTINGSAASSNLTMNGTIAQTISGTGVWTAYLIKLTINNTAGVTLNIPLDISTLTMTAGILNTTITNLLTIKGTAAASVSGGSTSSYVNGPLARDFASGLTGSSGTWTFPVGKTAYNLFELLNPNTTATGTVTVEVFDTDAGGTVGTGIVELNTNRYWSAQPSDAFISSVNVRLTEYTMGSGNRVTQSAILDGVYNSVGGTVAAPLITATAGSVSPSLGYFVLGNTGMTYTSSTTNHPLTTIVSPNSITQQILRIQIVTAAGSPALTFSSFTLNTTGTTDDNDIRNARLYYTGITNTFATTTQFGTTVANPTGTYQITDAPMALSSGTNYFWLTYDIPATATVGNYIDAECTSIALNTANVTPSPTAPVGNRIINLTYCNPGSGSDGQCGDLNYTDAAISAVNITNSGNSYFSYSGGTCMYSTYINLSTNNYDGPSAPLIPGVSYTWTVTKLNGGSQRVRIWIDWNNDGDMTDANEMILNSTSGTPTVTFTVPPTSPGGWHRMRAAMGNSYTDVTDPCDDGLYNIGRYIEYRDFTIKLAAPCAFPSVQATSFGSQNVLTTSCSVTFTRGNGDGGVLVVARQGAAVNSAPTPGVSYNANSTFGLGDITGTGNYVVYNSNIPASGPVTAPISGLTPGATYYFAIYEYNATDVCYNLTALTGNVTIPICIQPTVQVSGVTTSDALAGTFKINWTGNGDGDGGVIVFVKSGSVIGTDPTQTSNYNANSVWMSGTQIGATGAYCVYKGTGSSVTVTGLPAANYYYAVYTFNSSTNCYMLPRVSGGPVAIPICDQPTVQASGVSTSNIPITGDAVDINWTDSGNGNGGVIVFLKDGSAIATDPTLTTNYNANSIFGSGSPIGATGAYCVYKGTDNKVTVTGLTVTHTYYYAVYAYNSSTNCYMLTNPPKGNVTIYPPCEGTPTLGTPVATNPTICPYAATSLSVSTLPVASGYNYQWKLSTDGITYTDITGANSDSYAPSLTNVNSTNVVYYFKVEAYCTSGGDPTLSNAGTITVKPVPTITINNDNPYNEAVCRGSSTTLTANTAVAGATYAWSPATNLSATNIYNPVATPTVSITYTVTATASSCTSTATARITVNPGLITFNPTSASVTNGSSVILTAASSSTNGGGNINYSWSSPATIVFNTTNGSSVNASPTVNTTYTVTATDEAGCTRTGTVAVTVTAPGSGNPNLVSCGYSCVDASASYSQIAGAGATVIASGTSIDDVNYANQIFANFTNGSGFTFDYNGRLYDRFGINSNGFIWFGSTAPAANTYNPISTNSSVEGIVAAYGADLTSYPNSLSGGMGGPSSPSNPQLGVLISGTAPNRICTIEYYGWVTYGNSGGWDAHRINFQIKLHENGGTNSNIIDMHYQDQYPYLISSTRTAQVGLRGASSTDYNNRVLNNMWNSGSTTVGSANTSVVRMGGSQYINGNQRLRFTPTIKTPTVSGTGGTFCTGDPSIELTASTTQSPPNYQWQYYTAPSTYINITGETNPTFNFNPTIAGTYNIIVRSTNGSGCSRISYPPAVTFIVNDCCTPPAVQSSNYSIVSTTPNSATIDFTRGNGDAGVLILMKQGSAVNAEPSNTTTYTASTDFNFGSPTGSQIGAGNYVVYSGNSGPVTLTNLLPNTTYYFAFFEYNASGPCYFKPAYNTNTYLTTPDGPGTYISSTVEQINPGGTVSQGTTNNQVIRIKIVTGSGTNPPLTLSSLTLNTNGSTSFADINKARVYYTGLNSIFNTNIQYGNEISSFPGGSNPIVVNGSQTLLPNTTNYFWLVYDLPITATAGNFLDAECTSINVGTAKTPTVTAPANNLVIGGVGPCAITTPVIDAISPVNACLPPTLVLSVPVHTGTVMKWYKDNELIQGATGNSYSPTENGSYTAVGYYGGCGATSTPVNVSFYPSPLLYNVTGGIQCGNSTIGIDDSEIGINYQLLLDGTTEIGSPLAGTGNAISFGNQTQAGTYTVKAINAVSGCFVMMTGEAVINPLPTLFTLSGDAECTETTLSLSSSELGVSYQLMLDGTTSVGTLIAGTGNKIDFDNQTVPGTYTLVASNDITGCENIMTGSVLLKALPTVFNVTGGSSCTSLTIGLSGSQTGVKYQLYLGNTQAGTALYGTGAALSFGLKTSKGEYSVKATDLTTGCSVDMNGKAYINSVADIVTHPIDRTIRVDGTVVFSIASLGAGLSYQWQENGFNIVDGTGTPGYSGANNQILTLSHVLMSMSGYTYRCVVSSQCSGPLTSNTANLVVTLDGTPGLWTGNFNSEWNDEDNWDNGTVPISTTDVTVPGFTPYQPEANTNPAAECNNITIYPLASLDVLDGYSFTVNGNLLIKSNGIGTGAFKQSSTSTVTIIGSATVERFTNSIGYHYISTPINGATMNQLNDDVPLANLNGLHYNMEKPPTAAYIPNIFMVDEAHTHDVPYDQNCWKAPSGINDVMQNLRGYALNYKSTGVIVDITGSGSQLNKGDISYNVTKTALSTDLVHNNVKISEYGKIDPNGVNKGTGPGNGWHLIGNPYPSPIDWDEVTLNELVGTNIGYSIALFKTTADYYGVYGYYNYYIGGSGAFFPTQYIQSMQGFLVKNAGFTPNTEILTLKDDYRTVVGDALRSEFYKKAKSKDDNNAIIRISVISNDTDMGDEAVVYFRKEVVKGFDSRFDALKLFNTDETVPNIYFRNNDNNFAIKALTEITDNLVIPVNFIANKDGKYIFTAGTIQNIPTDINVYLYDMQTGKVHDLTLEKEYRFNATMTDNPDRFYLKFAKTASGITQVNKELYHCYSSDNTIFVNYSDISANTGELSVYNAEGKLVFEPVKLKAGAYKYDMDLATGVYVVKFVTTNKVYNSRIYIRNKF